MQPVRVFITSFFLSIFATVFSTAAFAAEAYIGQFLFKYDGGSVYRVTVNDAKSISWQCIQGPEKGANGVEKPERFKVADQIYFVSWVEKPGSMYRRSSTWARVKCIQRSLMVKNVMSLLVISCVRNSL